MEPIAPHFHMPATGRLGWGTLGEVGSDASRLHATSTLVVTTASLNRGTPIVRDVVEQLRGAGIGVTLDDHTTHVPDLARVDEGVRLYRANRCDLLVSVGGGNPHDLAKAIGVVVANGGSLLDWEGQDRLRERNPPHIAVNTTAGTGSELSRYTFIAARSMGRRVMVCDDRITPRVAINDPATHMSMPPQLTASSGMNLLSHAVEATLSRDTTPLAQALALDAMALVARYLERAVRDGRDEEARMAMAQAEQLAGTAYQEAGLGVCDAISLTLSAAYDAPHGEVNAIVLPYVMCYDLAASQAKLAEVASVLGAPEGDAAALARQAPGLVRDLARRVGLHKDLADFGVNYDTAYTFLWSMLESPLLDENPRPVTGEAVERILLDALEGAEPEEAIRELAPLAA